MMPRMNGFEFCKEIKENLNISHIPVILLTAKTDSESQMLGYKLGADAYLPKPFEMEMLLSVIQSQMRNREYIKSRYKSNQFVLSPQEASFSNADETFLLKLNTLIMDNMDNSELDVPFLAANMCLSRSLLFKKVKSITGLGIIDYVNKLRIEKSILLMNTTSMSISDISKIVGFSSLRYFSKVFKIMKGEIPSNYRKQNN